VLPVKRIVVPAKRRLTLREINGEASVMRVLSVLPDDTPTLKIAIVAVPLAAAVEVGATLLEHGHDVRSGRWEAAGVEPSPAVGRTPLSAWQRRLGGRMADGRWIRYIGVVAAGRHRHAQVFADTRTEFVVGGAFFSAPDNSTPSSATTCSTA